jgi:pyruvate/2-oxoglutarate dehydrogenase complex dihydrolipoamide acyltransferase (E2) component
VHRPRQDRADLAITLALGGDCLAGIALLRAQRELFGPVASDPTVSRLSNRLAHDETTAVKAVRAAARERARTLAGPAAPGVNGELIPIDLDATIVIADSDKEKVAPAPTTPTANRGPAPGSPRSPPCST